MVPLHSAEPSDIKPFKTVIGLTFPQIQNKNLNNTCTQPNHSSSTPTNKNTNSIPQNNNVHHHTTNSLLSYNNVV